MKRSFDGIVVRGAVGGLVAGAVVALWFLAVDTVNGRPFLTPALLAQILFARDTLDLTFGLVAGYSALHFGSFALLGVAAAWGLAAFERPPSLLAGFVFGALVLDLVFYGSIVLMGGPIFAVLDVPHVMAANILGGMSMMWYLHRATRDEHPFGLALLKGQHLLIEGIVTGLIGAATVAVWFFLVDVAARHPLRTPAALGSVLFLGAASPAAVQTGFGVVAAYTALHVVAFVAAGVAFLAAAEQIERAPRFILLGVLAFIVLDALIIGVVGLDAEWVLGTLGWWAVAAGNLLAVTAMGWRVWHTHPTLRRRMLEEPLHVRI